MFIFNMINVTRLSAVFLSGAALFIAGCSAPAANDAVKRSTPANQTSHVDTTGADLKTGQAKLGVPKIIEEEHRALHEELEAATKAGGKTGEAAKLVEERLAPHFKKEEEYALPQLGILAELAEGKMSADAKRAIELSDRLKAEMPRMLEEHKGIVEALDALKKAATEEKSEVGLKFVETLTHHAANEEAVMYPAAILVGEYLKIKTTNR